MHGSYDIMLLCALRLLLGVVVRWDL